jgi:hypothetical protein
MSWRVPGTIGVILNQTPQAGSASGGVRTTASNRAPLNPKELSAQPRVARSKAGAEFDCVRGDTIVLEAAAPTAPGRSYEWILRAEVPVVLPGRLYTEDNPPPARTVSGTKQGAKITVVALAPFTAILAVRDAVSSATSLPLPVRVQPRRWTTGFKQSAEFKTFNKFYSAHFLAEKHAGSNICAICGTDEPYSHQIHRPKDRLDWKPQFSVKQVEDPGGPFHGLWYVEKADLRIERSLYINSELTSGRVFKLNSRKDTLPEYREGLKARVECTKLHERLHGELVKKKLDEPGMDPAPRVEALLADDEESLLEQASTEVGLKENFLSNATTGPEGHGELRRRLQRELKATRVKFLLPRSEDDDEGIAVETDLLGFSDSG